ncbi:hypothetical protein EBT31_14115 [bacterium]|nr:hypothetical protein [bacterium]
MTLRIAGATSGYTEIDAPAVAGSNTLVLPTGNGTADQVISTNGSGALSFVDRGRMVLETAKASTSGTSVDFTGIPSWVKRITVMFNGVSTSGTSPVIIQVGSGSYVTSSYASHSTAIENLTQGSTASGAGFLTEPAPTFAAAVRYGTAILNLVGSNQWVFQSMQGVSGAANARTHFAGGASPSLGGTLDRLRITTVNGTDTFDAGSINILYEG